MDPVLINSQIRRTQHIFQDLAEGKRDNRQIVPGKTQHRNTDDHAEQSGCSGSDDECENHPRNLMHVQPRTVVEHNARSRSGQHKRRMAKRQLPEETDNQIQGNRHDRVGTDRDQQPQHLARKHIHMAHDLNHSPEDKDQCEGDDIGSCTFLSILSALFRHSYHLTLSLPSSCPAGRSASRAER